MPTNISILLIVLCFLSAFGCITRSALAFIAVTPVGSHNRQIFLPVTTPPSFLHHHGSGPSSVRRTVTACLITKGVEESSLDDVDKVLPTVASTGASPPSTSSRRQVFLQSAAAASALASPSMTRPAAAELSSTAASINTAVDSTRDTTMLLADLPMLRFRVPGSSSRVADYVGVYVCVPGVDKPAEFMLDTGLTLEMITPHLRQQMGLKAQRSSLQGLSAGGSSETNVVTWTGARLCSSSSGSGNQPPLEESFPLPELHAVVTDFPQEHVDPQHDPIEGMLGMELLSQYDVDLDFAAGRVRLYRPGTAASQIPGMDKKFVEIPAVVINETGLLGIRLTTQSREPKQPILAFLDCGSSFSAVNWQAAQYLGLPSNRNDPLYQRGPWMLAVGVDGRPLQLPTVPSPPLSFVGDGVLVPAEQDGQPPRIAGFAPPPGNWKPWNSVPALAVGDLPVFAELLSPQPGQRYSGPAALIGLDVLGQRRVIFEGAAPDSTTRRRRIFVEAQ